jgi:DNA polymerase-3 subunit delta'
LYGKGGEGMSGFKDVVGHKDIVQYIQNAVKQNKLSHAYILNGQRGSGKKLLSRLFAMTLQCETGQPEPCGECRSCMQTKNGNQPDIITVTHEKPATISVDDIREQLNGDVMIKPYSSPYKIYIIPEADLMTPQAQNALLKTLEEPPEYAVIFLLTENADSLLPTIRSRCVMLKLRNIKDKLVKKYLMEQLQVPDYQAELCAAFAQGNIGRAVMLAKSEHFNEIKDEAIQLLKYIDEMELHEIVGAIKQIGKYKLEVTDYLDILTIWYRDILLYKATKDVEGLVFGDQLTFIKKKASNSSYEGIETILTAIEKAKLRLKANVNFDLLMELLLLTIKEN